MSKKRNEAGTGVSPRAASGETGFLYVELLVAFSILAVVLVSTVPIFVLAARVGAASNDLTQEANLARDKVEAIQVANYKTLAAGTDSFRIDSRRYDRSWTVQNNTPYAGMKTITVTVQPSNQLNYGTPRVFTLSLVRAE